MHASTVVLIQTYYRRFNAADWDGFLSLLTDDVIHDINQGGREIGMASFREFLRRMDRCYSEQIIDLSITTSDDGTRAAAEFTVVGHYRNTDTDLPVATGQRYRLPAGAFFDIADGRVARISNYYNLQAWLKQIAG